MKKAISILLTLLLLVLNSCGSALEQSVGQKTIYDNGTDDGQLETSKDHQLEFDQTETNVGENHIKYSEERDEWYDEDAGIWLGYITVIMIPEEGYKCLDYCVEDFPEVPGKYIIDGSSFVKNNMKKYLEETGKTIEELMPDYRQVIYIRVDASSVEEIYSWIEILLQRDDILSAEVSPEKTPTNRADSNSEEKSEEHKIIYSEELDDWYDEDEGIWLGTITVVMSSEESYKLLDYSIYDFPEIPCKSVIDASSGRKKQLREQIDEDGGTVEELFPEYKQILILRVDATSVEEIRSWIQILLQREDILSAEAAPIMTLCSTYPDDTYFTNQTGLYNINAPEAWDLCKKAKQITIVVIDSGISGSHLDLYDNIVGSSCKTFLSGSAVSETIPTDPRNHGTRVAGIIGAYGNNSIGICGVCWETNLVSFKVLPAEGMGNPAYAILAINEAESIGADLINMSVGWLTDSYNSCLNAALSNFSGLVICSAGNDGNNTDITPHYPSSCSNSNIITVGAMNQYYTGKHPDSNYGYYSVDLFAPGDHIYCTSASGGYAYDSGTSLAVPFVTATAALLMTYYPQMTPAQVKAAILDNVNVMTSLSGYCLTGGCLDVYAALSNP